MDNQAEASAHSAPIFIIGSPRSGSSILAWSLHEHSQMWTSGESYFLFDFYGQGREDLTFRKAKELGRGSWLYDQDVEKAEFLQYLGLGIDALFSSRAGGRRWIDHTLDYTLMVDTLAEMFPNALFLHILRDGRRVVHSMMHFHNVLGRQPNASVRLENYTPDWSTDFTIACKTWSLFVETSMDFCSRYPERCLTVINEEMVANTEKCFRSIFQFLGVTWEKGPSNCFSNYRINSSFHPDANDPALVQRLSQPWDEWSLEQKRIFLDVAAPCLIKYGLAREYELVVDDDSTDTPTEVSVAGE